MQKTLDPFPRHRGAGGLLSPEVVAFIESGLSIVVGLVGPGGLAVPARGMALRILPGNLARLIYPGDRSAALIAAAEARRAIAVTLCAPMSYRSLQLKGATCHPLELDAEDRAAALHQAETFAATLKAMGYPSFFVQAFRSYTTAPMCGLEFQVTEAFEQTPGPGAGGSI